MRWIFFCPAIRPIVLCEHFRISAASAWVFPVVLIGLPSPLPYIWTHIWTMSTLSKCVRTNDSVLNLEAPVYLTLRSG